MRTLALLLLVGCATVAQAQPPKTYTPATPPRPGEETVLNARVVSVDRAGSRLTVRGVDVKADGGSNETFTVAAPASSRLAELKPGHEVFITLRGTTIVDLKVSVASGGEGGNVIQGTATGTRSRPATRGRTGSAAATGAATPAPGMVGIAPGTGAARTNAQGTIILQGSPAPAGSPRAAVTPAPETVPAVGTAPPPVIVVAPPPAAGGTTVVAPADGRAPAGVIGGVIYIAPPSPVPQGTPFPTPRPVATPVPVGAPPVVATPVPVLVPADPPPSPATGPTPSPATSPQAP